MFEQLSASDLIGGFFKHLNLDKKKDNKMFNSKKQIAIRAFEKQLKALRSNEVPNDWVWISQTLDLIGKYIGTETSSYHTMTQFKFGVLHEVGESKEVLKFELDEKIRKAERIIVYCIEYVKSHGVVPEPKLNFMQSVDSKTLWAIFIGVLGLAYAAGIFTKTFTIDREKIALEEKVKAAEDENITLKKIISNNPPKNTSQIKTIK